MYTFIAQNKYGQRIELTHNDAYVIESIEGLDPPEATINTTHNANADGSMFNSSYVNNRQIIITLAVNAPTEENRIALYKYFKNKYPVRLFYKNNTRDVYIDGYVKNTTIGLFEKKQIVQVVVICPEPFFKNVTNEMVDFSNIQGLFEFPFSIASPPGEEFGVIELDSEKDIINKGDVETGAEFYLGCRWSLTNPIIYNTSTNEFFKLNFSMVLGDEIYINTIAKEKTVTLKRNGETTNIINCMASGSSWFTLLPGDNLFLTSADTNPQNLEAYCVIRELYEGV